MIAPEGFKTNGYIIATTRKATRQGIKTLFAFSMPLIPLYTINAENPTATSWKKIT